jgi:hypothetical protein
MRNSPSPTIDNGKTSPTPLPHLNLVRTSQFAFIWRTNGLFESAMT